MTPMTGRPVERVDGMLKVTGLARFTPDLPGPGTTHGAIVTSTVARGRVSELHLAEAEAVPGVLGILTHHNALRLHHPDGETSPFALSGIELTLQGDRVYFDRQPVAVVVAETADQARRAAALVRVAYLSEAPRVSLDAQWERRYNPGSFLGEPADFAWGDAPAAWAAAPARVEATYATPWEHHNPIELHNTMARWDDDRLEVHDSTQFVGGVQLRLATLLGMNPAKIRVVCRRIGGGFGSKGQCWPHVMLAVMAARLVGRPVHLSVTREQLFGMVGHRSLTRQTVRLGADRHGRLVSHEHQSTSQTSEFADYVEPVGRSVSKLYACPNVSVSQRLVRLDTNTSTFMRAPGDSTGLFALESAMDELAIALGMDPVALRVINHADREPGTGRPWSSKALKACYEQASRRFGWSRRSPAPGSMRDAHHLVGWGMASASLHTARATTRARVCVKRDGTAEIQCATHELGTGITTVMTQIVADALGLALDHVRGVIGDTALPAAPLSAGSQTTASVGPAVRLAAHALRDSLIHLAIADAESPLFGMAPEDLHPARGGLYERGRPGRGESFGALLGRQGREEIAAVRQVEPVDEDETPQAMRAFGCHFVEVRVDPDLGTITVSRYVGAFAAGRILNPLSARSQLTGGVVWGIGMALSERAVRDARRGRVMNANFADYLIPVAADVPELDVILVSEADTCVNALGAKGIGELGITGMAAAIANAVHHATGKRLRELPMTLEALL